MVSTNVLNRLKAAAVASTLAFSVVLYVPAVAYAAPKNDGTVVKENQGKHLGQLKQTETTNETPASQPTAHDQTSGEEKSNSKPVVVNSEIPATTKKTTDPAGNNGTVKIDRAPFDSHPDNQPHVTCTFQVDFYGYDKGVGNAKVTFELHNPTLKGRTLTVTSGNLTPNIGEDAAGGGTDLDAEETYTLAFTGAPHEKQGYHVKLTVNAPGSQGSDVKHKVFWVEHCETPATPTTPTTPGQGGGQILGEAASTSRGAILPAHLPSTGAGLASAIVTALLMTAAYFAAYRGMVRHYTK